MEITPEEKELRTWSMVLHASQFIGPFPPLLIWLVKRQELPAIDAHAKAVANWMISEFVFTVIYWIIAIASWILLYFKGIILAYITIPYFVIMTITGLLCPILAAKHANEGKPYKYPASIRVFK